MLLQAWMQDVDVCIDLVLYLLKVVYFQWKCLIILIFFSDMTLGWQSVHYIHTVYTLDIKDLTFMGCRG